MQKEMIKTIEGCLWLYLSEGVCAIKDKKKHQEWD